MLVGVSLDQARIHGARLGSCLSLGQLLHTLDRWNSSALFGSAITIRLSVAITSSNGVEAGFLVSAALCF
jgi:hypothetical protein